MRDLDDEKREEAIAKAALIRVKYTYRNLTAATKSWRAVSRTLVPANYHSRPAIRTTITNINEEYLLQSYFGQCLTLRKWCATDQKIPSFPPPTSA